VRKTEIRREYPDIPLVGVGGVIIKDEKILLTKRKREPGKGQWSIPGGLVEPGETLVEAVIREIKEETNLEVEALKPIYTDEVVVRDEESRIRYHYVLIDYLCRLKGGSLRPGDDAKEVRWIKLSEAKKLNLTRSTYRLIDRLTEGFFLVVRNRDVKRVLIGTPRGHKHHRVIFELTDGSIIVFHEATMENLARAMVELEMHPYRKAICLVGRELDNRKEGYDKYQLIEEDIPEDEVIGMITKLLGMERANES